MKEIAILTFYTSKNNYGQILQGYALQTYLKQNGYNAYIVKFNSFKSLLKERIIMLPSLRGLYCKEDRLRDFKKFKSSISYSLKTYYSFSSLDKNFPKADFIITGSDQIWAYMRNKERRNAYLLNFTNDLPKISYAASFGRNHLQKDEINMFRVALKKYEAVLVREQSGVDICKKMGIDNAMVVCDPVALLNPEQWRELSTSVDLPHNGKKNIFVYSLAEGNYETLSILIDKLKENFNFITAYVGKNGKKSNVFPTIQEWLGYIDKCDFVITDSFHGTLFSILFGTPFITIKSKERAMMNDRLFTLFDYTSLLTRYVDISDIQKVDKLINNIKPIYIDSKFQRLIDISKDKLNEILSISLNH